MWLGWLCHWVSYTESHKYVRVLPPWEELWAEHRRKHRKLKPCGSSSVIFSIDDLRSLTQHEKHQKNPFETEVSTPSKQRRPGSSTFHHFRPSRFFFCPFSNYILQAQTAQHHHHHHHHLMCATHFHFEAPLYSECRGIAALQMSKNNTPALK